LFTVKFGQQMSDVLNLTPWRVNQPITVGRIRLALQQVFRQVSIRDWWNAKSRKFKPPTWVDFEPLNAPAT